MGLDMYLYKTKKQGSLSFDELYEEYNDMLENDELTWDEWEYLNEELIYWRKSNHIHNWFVENIQNKNDDCENYIVTKKQLSKLLDVVNEAVSIFQEAIETDGFVKTGEIYTKGIGWQLNYIEGKVYEKLNVERLKEVLPTVAGFFFGSTEYNQWYYEAILHTQRKLKEVLEEVDFEENHIWYTSSW